jgi:peptidyl-Lys metalloendopeptidase
MLGFKKWVLSAVFFTAVAGLHAAPRDPIDVRLSVPRPVLKGDVDVVVTVTVTNTGRSAVSLLKSQLPSSSLEGPLFQITRNDERVAYHGRVVKRATPQAADIVRLEPGATLNYDVELTAGYDLSQNGRYTIEYASRGRHGDAVSLASEPLYLWLEERSGPAALAVAAAVAPVQSLAVTTASLAFSSCSASRQTTIKSAITSATSYATSANTYLSATPALTQRFKKWFGSSTSRWSTVKAHYAAVEDAFKNKAVTVDCSCTETDTYAYVYPTQPYKIYVCGAFWSAPLTGTDSKAGTLIHEMTHFNVVASTDDWAYGQSAAAALAISNPARAVDNADSHEYFAENSPALP